MEGKYSIKVISQSCGILPHTLRVWEQRYSVFSPDRSEGGQRLYSEQDLIKAKLISKLIDHGHTISNLAKLEVSELEKIYSQFESATGETDPNKNIKVTKSLLKFLVNYDLKNIAEELQHARLNLSAKEFIFQIALPTIREVGNLVARGKYSVTQEHIISTVIRDQLSQIVMPNIGDETKEVALATPEGNLHELSIILGEILCRSCRVPTRYLGAAHPAECLGEALSAMKTPNLILGVVSSDSWDYDKKIIPYLEKLDKHLKSPLVVLLGGGRKMEFPQFKNISEVIVLNDFESLNDWLS
ncbi:MAG: MerR family transcriptional regulator [Bacteriovoracaceae bacterium]|nr:MerR family transcriptional regulator [Bacteriovoracaceae bacterium]